MLRRNMTPDQLVKALLAPPPNPFVEIDLRTGLRLEQITAKLQTLPALEMDPREFYELAKEPPAALIADYPWLRRRPRRGSRGDQALAGGLPVARQLPRAARHDPRGADPPDAGRLHRGRREAKLKVPDGPRADLLPGAGACLDRRARGCPGRGTTAHRRGVPEPHRRDPRHQEQDPQRRPDGHLRLRHGRARRRSSSIPGRATPSGRCPRASR